ncbi:MAG: hypothetical protein ISS70_00320 [Phycisphaerae bacterium]|nr:hypothetical protein [Phycisphaerae bacterium]
MNIAQELKQVEKKIERLEFDLAVEKAVYVRLKAIDTGNQPSLFGSTQPPTTPGSMPSHIEAVLINAGKPMTVSAILKAVKERGATSASEEGLKNNIRGTLKRRGDLFARHDRGVYKLVRTETQPVGEELKE